MVFHVGGINEYNKDVTTVYCLQDVAASITSQVAFYDLARPEHMSLECITADTDDIPPPGYDVVRKENMPSPEYETIASAKAGKPTPITSENPPPLPHPMIKGDEGLDNDGVLTEETTDITAQAKEEPTEDGGDGGLETKIAAQVRAIILYTCSVYTCNAVCDMFMCGILYPKLTAACLLAVM